MPSPEAASAPARADRVLVVDDDGSTRILLEELLLAEGYEVRQASDGGDALRVLADWPADVIVSDINMLPVSGLELLRRVRAGTGGEDLPVVMMTADRDGDLLREAFDDGAADFLPKPFSRLEMLVRLRAATRLGRAMRSLREQQAQLRRTLDELDRDLAAAARLQRSLLPDPGFAQPGLSLAHDFRPTAALGGDGFDVIALGEGIVGFYLVDVAGHGAAAALHAVAIGSLLRGRSEGGSLCYDAQGRVREPAEVVARLNQRFPMEQFDDRYFTLCYGIIDLAARRLQLVRAGQTPPLLSHGDREEAIEEGDLPVGVDPEAVYTTITRTLPGPARLVLYSDGIPELRRPGAEPFGDARLRALLSAQREASARDTAAAVVAALDDWLGDNAAPDDRSLVILDVL